MRKTILLIVCCALLVVSGSAQAPDKYKGCSPIGVWYNGGYLMTFTPNGEGFMVRGEPVFDFAQFGLKSWTAWSGQLVRKGGNLYVLQEIQMLTSTADVIELDGYHGRMEFVDCKNFKLTGDFYAAYFDPNKEPFVDPPDVNYMPPEGIVEYYHRMPTQCPACNLPSAAVSQPRQRR
jgi:hypothetical protein